MRARSLVAALVTAAVLGLASPALAHNSVVATTPEADATLTVLPESFEIRTDDALLDLGGEGAGFAFLVQDAAGLYYGDGCVRVSGPSMLTTPALGAPGEYTVTWQLVSADGHSLSGSYGFAWEPEDGTPPAGGSAERPRCGEESPPAASGTPEPAEPGAPDAEGGDGAEGARASVPADVWWIAGAVAAIAVTAVVTLLLLRRRESR